MTATDTQKKASEKLLPNMVFETSSLMLNENSGFDRKCQINKVHNLKFAAKAINKVIIEPQETVSFWQLVLGYKLPDNAKIKGRGV